MRAFTQAKMRRMQYELDANSLNLHGFLPAETQPSEEKETPKPNDGIKNDEYNKKLMHPYQLRRMEIKDPEYMSEVPEHLKNKDLPCFPSTILCVGEPGSGKTNVLMNLLTRDDMWKGFFDRIYFLGPTVKSDKLYQHIKVPDDQVVHNEKDFLSKLEEWVTSQVDQVEQNPRTAPKALFVFEDITSYYNTIQTSPIFVRCFNTIRHHKAVALANIHKYKALQRTARVSCMQILIWPVVKSEIDQIYEDFGPKNLKKKDFHYLCEDAWQADEFNKKPFLFINKYADRERRYRKCFTHIINPAAYEGRHQSEEAAKKRKLKDFTNNSNEKDKRSKFDQNSSNPNSKPMMRGTEDITASQPHFTSRTKGDKKEDVTSQSSTRSYPFITAKNAINPRQQSFRPSSRPASTALDRHRISVRHSKYNSERSKKWKSILGL